MELLASVHWVAVHKASPARTASEAEDAVHAWTPRKRAMFKPEHIRIAWDHLRDLDWLPTAQSDAI